MITNVYLYFATADYAVQGSPTWRCMWQGGATETTYTTATI